jgi:hypothetical protein
VILFSILFIALVTAWRKRSLWRVVTYNTDEFKIQERGWFFWHDYRELYHPTYSNSDSWFRTVSFRTKEDAKIKIESLKREHEFYAKRRAEEKSRTKEHKKTNKPEYF